MNDYDELNDRAVLDAVRDSVSGLPIPAPPRVAAITARGRARQRRRLAGLSVAGVGACAALVVGLAGTGGSAGLAPQAGHPAQHNTIPVHLAAFSVAAGPDGSTTLTLYPGQVANPDAVRQALAEHGIPALVTAGKFCRTADQPAPGVGAVVDLGPQKTIQPGSGAKPSPIVIDGSKIPAGVELSIGYRQSAQENEISFSLIKAGAPLTCVSLPDSGPHGND
jgi:hypothetical protein